MYQPAQSDEKILKAGTPNSATYVKILKKSCIDVPVKVRSA